MTGLLKIVMINNDDSAFSKYRRFPVWRENGFELCTLTDDTDEAIKLMHKENIAFALVFNKPPQLDAAAIVDKISKKAGRCEMLVISPHGDPENMRECFLAGVTDYLCEPVSEVRIKEALIRAKKKYDKATESREYRLAVNEYFNEFETKCSDKKFSDNLREFISSCEGVIVTTESAADHFGFNKDYFGRLFKARTGMTFGDFYKRFRVLYGEKLLLSGRYRVYEVSELLGFSTVDYFTSVFKKLTGKRPSELKK
ncbi:MAG: helix-turn-helix domain-containing protein [Ruminococcus sp.]|nr:helix-turn-helix domain-containing protein [Ruminococcus sp.]